MKLASSADWQIAKPRPMLKAFAKGFGMRALLIACLLFMSPSLNGNDQGAADAGHEGRCIETRVGDGTIGSARLYKTCVTEFEPALSDQPSQGNGDKKPSQDQDAGWQQIDSGRNVDAQEAIANRTKIIVWFTFAGLILNGIGLRFVYRTIQQNRLTFDHIQKTSVEEFKPYFSFGQISDIRASTGENGRLEAARFNLIIENIGKSKATVVDKPVIDSFIVIKRFFKRVGSSNSYYWARQESTGSFNIEFREHLAPTGFQRYGFDATFGEPERLKDTVVGINATYLCITGHIDVEDISTSTGEVRRVMFYGESKDWPTQIHSPNEITSSRGDYNSNSIRLGLDPIDIDNMVFTITDDRILSKHEA